MRSGACPTTRIHHTCRARARQEVSINLAIITIGTEIGLVRLANHHASRPRARPLARTGGKRRQRAKTPQRPPEAPEAIPAPTLIQGNRTTIQAFLLSKPDPKSTTRRPPGGGGLPLPAAASAAPLKSCKTKGAHKVMERKILNIEGRRVETIARRPKIFCFLQIHKRISKAFTNQ